jgi:hypothetical protein
VSRKPENGGKERSQRRVFSSNIHRRINSGPIEHSRTSSESRGKSLDLERDAVERYNFAGGPPAR